MALTIKEAFSREDRERVYRLRYEIYVKEMGRLQPGTDHAREMIEEPFDATGHLLLAEEDGIPVGTVRANFLREGRLEHAELYDLDQFEPYYPIAISMTTKLMVRSAHRSGAVSARLAAAAYSLGRSFGILADFIDTNPHLVRMYQRMGYRFYKQNIRHPAYGTVIPMVLLLGDRTYLETIRSPFLELAMRCPLDDGAESFFRERFPKYSTILPNWMLDDEQLWQSYAECSAFDNARKSGLLRSLDDAELKKLVGHFDVLNYLEGDVVIGEGDFSQGMFCLIEGQAEVRRGKGADDRVVDILHVGDVFGEMGFIARTRRNASVVIRQPARVLVLSEAEFRKFSVQHPQLANKLLTHLFTTVVERFNAAVLPGA